jgi:hypothetical protein
MYVLWQISGSWDKDQSKRVTSNRSLNLAMYIETFRRQISPGRRKYFSSAGLKGLYEPCELELAVRQEQYPLLFCGITKFDLPEWAPVFRLV